MGGPDLGRSFLPVDDVRSHDLRFHDLRWGDDCLRRIDDADGLIGISSFADEHANLSVRKDSLSSVPIHSGFGGSRAFGGGRALPLALHSECTFGWKADGG